MYWDEDTIANRMLTTLKSSNRRKVVAQNNTVNDISVNNIVKRLLTLDPYRIVLFGSHALDRDQPESDVDLLVILDSETISQTYQDRIHRRIAARRCILEANKKIPIDLLVYTRAEYEYLLHQGVSFLNEIEKSGKTVYEKQV